MKTSRRGFFGMLAGLAASSFVPAPIRDLFAPELIALDLSQVSYKVRFSVGLTPDATRRVRVINPVIGQWADYYPEKTYIHGDKAVFVATRDQ